MTEKEKMLSGALYNAGDLELVWERDRAKALCEKLNVLPSGDGPARERVLSQLFGHTGGNIVVNSVFWCDYGYNIRVGDDFMSTIIASFGLYACHLWGQRDDRPQLRLYTASHPMDAERRRAGWEYAAPITVGSDVWFGGGVTVLPGVTIGDGAVIGAGSVVTRNIPPHVLAAGNPCRPVRPITQEDGTIQFPRESKT